MKMAGSVVHLLVVVLSACASFPSLSFGGQLKSDVEQAKLNFSRLESLIKDTILGLNAKSLYLNESQTHIEGMEFQLERLQIEMSILKVRLLWKNLRKSNFKIHLLEAKAQEADNRLESITSQVEMMAAIVTEQWLQIQQLEQALHIAQMRASKAKKARMFKRCSFLKWVGDLFSISPRKLNGISELFLFEEKSAIGFYLSRALDYLHEIFTAAKFYHHELQGFIKHEMERNEYTATLANDEVVFFLASAVFTFPIMGAWMWLVSQFN